MNIRHSTWFYCIEDGSKIIRFKDLIKYAVFEGSTPDEAIDDIVKKYNCRKKAGIAGFNTRDDAQKIIDWIESYMVMEKLTE